MNKREYGANQWILKEINSWIFIGRTDADAEAEAPKLWPPDGKTQLTGDDDLDAGKDWRQEEKGVAEDETDSITDSMNMNLSKLLEIVEERGVCHAAAHGVTKELDTT